MIEISVYYLLGSIVVLPTISIYFTREYYKNKIYNLIEYYQDIIKIEKEMYDHLINKCEENNSFEANKQIIENFFKNRDL